MQTFYVYGKLDTIASQTGPALEAMVQQMVERQVDEAALSSREILTLNFKELWEQERSFEHGDTTVVRKIAHGVQTHYLQYHSTHSKLSHAVSFRSQGCYCCIRSPDLFDWAYNSRSTLSGHLLNSQ